ncbi:MAG: cytochrome c, partial [candidate division KSB1 bacterium]|nr:cytochrome c [candidate division KSB1 bacterium]
FANESSTEENYFKYCSGCHGEDGEPVKNGVTDLRDPSHKKRAGRAGFIRVISEGRGRMPAFEERLSRSEIEALADYAMRMSK